MDEAAGLLSAADGLLTTCDVRKGAEIYIVCLFFLRSAFEFSSDLFWFSGVLLLQATAPVFRSRRGLVFTSNHIKPKRRLFWVPTCTLVDKSGFFYTAKGVSNLQQSTKSRITSTEQLCVVSFYLSEQKPKWKPLYATDALLLSCPSSYVIAPTFLCAV